MALIFKWLLRFATLLVVLAVVAILGAYYLASRSLPQYEARVAVDGLGAEVEIVRDTANVPHIFGQSDEDVFFGLGYAHAQDRLWQLTMLRRTGQGRLSELFGEATLEIDTFIRRLDLYALAVQSVAVQDQAGLAALTAYAKGVNARIRQINDEALGRGAPEFFLFPAEIAPWTPADSLVVMKLMALQLSDHFSNEILRAQLSLALPEELVEDLMPIVPGPGVAELPDYASLFPGRELPPPAQVATAARHPLTPVRPAGLAGASNAWAATPARSASGGTLLANDPHLGFTAPSTWYLARLELASGGLIGGSIPGLPLILSGRSATLGWGLTTTYADDQDLHIEALDPENPARYRTPDGYAEFRTRESIVKVKGQPPITLTLRWTENGPVLPEDQFEIDAVTPPGHVMSLAWTGLSGRDTSFSSALKAVQSDSVEGALAGFESYLAPVQTVTLADRERVAMKVIGAIPQRDPRHQSQGRLPTPGWRPENQWQGRASYAMNPEFTDPEGGILGNTNNKIIDRPFPDHISFHWGDTQRIQRWRRLMQSRQVHTRDSFIEAQLDTVSPTARTLLPLIGADLWFTGEAAPEGTMPAQRERALALLADWNGEMNEHLPEPLIYAAWVRALQTRLIRDELGPLARRITRVSPLFLERVYRDIDGAARWCDVIQSAPVESCADIARLALDDALVEISRDWGDNLDALRWGDAHEATHDHQTLGKAPLLRYFANIRHSTSGGDQTLQRGMTRSSGDDPYQNIHGAGYRGVYDFADPDSSVFVIATGQSGHLLSRHYDDLGELWRRGEYVPMSLDPALARAAATGITVLTPR
ncbi:penicillin acylase family protein [Poseidonocella sedimentorum]|uniref:Penicillin amidase n=1 Tax=Poseidonocella sedimentorum TaxID=871652 RepID=A0A1I6E7V1_9RHOB|nr:penicillin acylase family protein [Poseidonocella sedimentorum]SFR13804.1 penicillin amidase [Poseidonocella sedimentorum]